MSFLSAIEFSAQITLPIFMVVVLGYLLYRSGFLTDAFVQVGSKLVFSIALPTLIFLKIIELDWQSAVNGEIVLFAVLATLVCFALCWWLASILGIALYDKGVFVQGACRSNLGIIGLALCVNAYGDDGLGIAALLLALVTALYNVVSIIVLSVPMQQMATVDSLSKQRIDVKVLCLGIVKNPLIISICLALIYSLLSLRLPTWVQSSAENIAAITLPLALLCIGASVDLKVLRSSSSVSLLAAAIKLLFMPLLLTLAAYAVGFRSVELGVMCLLFASPTAAVSFVMVKGIGGNASMAANILVLTTVCSLVTTSIALFILRLLGIA